MRGMSQVGVASSFEVSSGSPEQTMAFGRQLGSHLRAGDVVLLFAPFGAGKTHLTKGIAAAFGVNPDDVNSPSFVLVNQYDAAPKGYPVHGRVPIFHVDLYRIDTPEELPSVGLDDLISDRSLVIIEWAEHAGAWLPSEHLAIRIDVAGERERVLHVQGHGERYRQLVERLKAEG
jgi:tRNA threonylcarbamoyladenosine biosynthesis protein TsaE